MVNSVLPALVAGNAVILKPSPQTPLSAERFALAFHNAGVPKDVLQVVHLSPALTARAVAHTLVDFVAFTGSVAGGRAVDIAAAQAKGFKGVGLEVSAIRRDKEVRELNRLMRATARRQGSCVCARGCRLGLHGR